MGGSAKKQAGARIRRLRKGRNLSQQALAAAVGVHVNTVARWESDGIDPHHPMMPLIAAALCCPLERLTGEPFISYRRADGADGVWSASKRAVLEQFLAAYQARLAELPQGP